MWWEVTMVDIKHWENSRLSKDSGKTWYWRRLLVVSSVLGWENKLMTLHSKMLEEWRQLGTGAGRDMWGVNFCRLEASDRGRRQHLLLNVGKPQLRGRQGCWEAEEEIHQSPPYGEHQHTFLSYLLGVEEENDSLRRRKKIDNFNYLYSLSFSYILMYITLAQIYTHIMHV